MLFATAAYLAGLYKYFRSWPKVSVSDELFSARSATARVLLAGGLVLILLGFAHGAYCAAVDLYSQEALDYTLLSNMATASVSHDLPALDVALASYGESQGDKAVKIAAHAHIIEFGLLAMILSFVQPYVSLSEKWQRPRPCKLASSRKRLVSAWIQFVLGTQCTAPATAKNTGWICVANRLFDL